MSANYVRLTANTMEVLPEEKQAEVYNFAKFLKTKSKNNTKRSIKKISILDLIGIGESGYTDIALNHDKYLYE